MVLSVAYQISNFVFYISAIGTVIAGCIALYTTSAMERIRETENITVRDDLLQKLYNNDIALAKSRQNVDEARSRELELTKELHDMRQEKVKLNTKMPESCQKSLTAASVPARHLEGPERDGFINQLETLPHSYKVVIYTVKDKDEAKSFGEDVVSAVRSAGVDVVVRSYNGETLPLGVLIAGMPKSITNIFLNAFESAGHKAIPEIFMQGIHGPTILVGVAPV